MFQPGEGFSLFLQDLKEKLQQPMPNATNSELYYISFFLAYQFQLQTASDVIRVKQLWSKH